MNSSSVYHIKHYEMLSRKTQMVQAFHKLLDRIQFVYNVYETNMHGTKKNREH